MLKHKLMWLIVVLFLAGNTGVKAATPLTALSGATAEGRILTDAVKILLEKNLDVEIEHLPNFSADYLMHQAMISQEADFYVSYTGTQFTGVLGMEVTEEWKNREKVYAYVRDEFQEQFNVSWLEPFGFNNTYAIAVRRQLAEKYNLQTMSDLQKIAGGLTLGMASIFRERPGDGFAAMNEAYGFSWGKAVGMDYGLLYRAAQSGDVDVIVGHSTDGRIPALDLVVLADDGQFFPPYDCALLVRNELLQQFPQIPEILAPLLGRIDEETMAAYNKLVDVEHREFMDVAQQMVDELAN